MNTIHEYNIDSIEFSQILDCPKTMTVPAVMQPKGDMVLYREYVRYTIDYTENPPKETFDFSGRVILQRIVDTIGDCTTIDTVFTGVIQ